MGDPSAERVRKERKAYKKEPFLKAFAKCGTILGAAKIVGINRELVYDWKKFDPAFVKKFQESRNELVERLENNILECAMDKAHPNHLGANIFLLKAHAPEMYTERLRHEADPNQLERIIALFSGVIKRTIPPDLWPTVSAALTSACGTLQSGKGQELLS